MKKKRSMSESQNLKGLSDINLRFSYLIFSNTLDISPSILHNKMRVLDKVIFNGIVRVKFILFINSASWSKVVVIKYIY